MNPWSMMSRPAMRLFSVVSPFSNRYATSGSIAASWTVIVSSGQRGKRIPDKSATELRPIELADAPGGVAPTERRQRVVIAEQHRIRRASPEIDHPMDEGEVDVVAADIDRQCKHRREAAVIGIAVDVLVETTRVAQIHASATSLK